MSDEDIVDAFRRGDERATGELYNRYGRLVFAVCLRVLNDRGRSEDAVQQTFVHAWRSAHMFEADRAFGPWLATIARRVAIDVARQDARHRNDSLDATTGPSTANRNDAALIALPPNAEQIETVWKVREAVDALPEGDRTIMRMLHFEGAQYNEIADHLGIPIGTVKSRGFRIHKQLAGVLRSLQTEGGAA